MLDCCPIESKYRKHLEDHLIQRSQLRSGEADFDPSDSVQAIRKMEMLWAESIMSSLDKLRDKNTQGRRNITNNTLLDLFIGLAEKKNTYKFCYY